MVRDDRADLHAGSLEAAAVRNAVRSRRRRVRDGDERQTAGEPVSIQFHDADRQAARDALVSQVGPGRFAGRLRVRVQSARQAGRRAAAPEARVRAAPVRAADAHDQRAREAEGARSSVAAAVRGEGRRRVRRRVEQVGNHHRTRGVMEPGKDSSHTGCRRRRDAGAPDRRVGPRDGRSAHSVAGRIRDAGQAADVHRKARTDSLR